MSVLMAMTLGLVIPAPVEDLPLPLRRMLDARVTLFDTAHIEWRYVAPSGTRYYSSRYAGTDYLLVDLGDETGCQDAMLCEKQLALAYSESRHLFRGAQRDQWNYRRDALTASYCDAQADRFDFQLDPRNLGMLPVFGAYRNADALDLRKLFYTRVPEGMSFDVQMRPTGLWEVTAQMESAGITWLLDPEIDWQPVSVERFRVDQGWRIPTRTATTQYDVYKDRWFAKRSTFVSHTNNTEYSVEIDYALFDDPSLPTSLDLMESTGLVPGVNVTHSGAGPSELEVFDGAFSVPLTEMNERLRQGDWPDCSRFRQLIQQWDTDAPGKTPSYYEDVDLSRLRSFGLWEPYTRRFIRRARLTRQQEAAAWAILARCQQTAYAILDKDDSFRRALEDTSSALERAKLRLRNPTLPTEEKQSLADELHALQKRQAELAAPINTVFERRLRPGLEGLLSTEQRARWKERERQTPAPSASGK